MAIDLGDIPTGTPPTAGEKLQIRSAIGVGTTDAPTFFNILTSNSNFAVGSIGGKNRIDGAGTVPYAIRFISNLDQLGGIKLGEDGINLGGTYLTGPIPA
ncbi:MAG: hypothetical protein JZU63_06395 [Rhodoferax sp.]|nr:hypothetical protein [Rhodoferax sp.]